MNRTERLLDLITYLLNAREPVSWQEIKNHFPDDYAVGIEESNQRKFERDKAELIALGIPIDYQSSSEGKKEGYIIQKENLFLPEVEFTPEESSLLMLSAGAVQNSENFPYGDQLESALHKITSVQDTIQPAPREMAITYSRGDADEARSQLIHELQIALDRRKSVELVYHAFSTGETTRRKVDPYGLIFRRGQWTLVGWDHLREALRSFVVSRIRELTVNTRRPGTPDYQIPPSFSLRSYQDQQPWKLDFHPPVEVVLRISEHRLAELRSQLNDAESLDEQTFQIEVTNQSGLVSWVLSQKTDVEVLAPASIQDQIRSLALGLLQ